MPMINFSNPIAVLIAVVLFVLVLILARSLKKSYPTIIMLGVCVILLIAHTVEFVLFANTEYIKQIVYSITVDFIFVFMSFFSYLWVDDIESKEFKRKSIDNSLDWFWSKV